MVEIMYTNNFVDRRPYAMVSGHAYVHIYEFIHVW